MVKALVGGQDLVGVGEEKKTYLLWRLYVKFTCDTLTHANDNITTFKDTCQSALSWQRLLYGQDCCGERRKNLFVAPILKIDMQYLSRVDENS